MLLKKLIEMLKKDKFIGFWIQGKDKDLLIQVCESRGEDLSNFIRGIIRRELAKLSYLSQKEKKALGVKNEGD
jgi:hypothetical protein